MAKIEHITIVKKCEITKDKLQWCAGMERNLLGNNGASGLESVIVANLKDPKARMAVAGVRYKINAKDRGMMLNVCPWCRANLLPKHLWKPSKKEKPRAA